MAMQAGVSTSKVLILVGAGLTGSVVLRSGRLSDIIFQLQQVLKGVNEAEISPNKYDAVLLAAQIRQLAQEIKELTMSRPINIFNGNSESNGSYASYIVPAAAIGAMGYCYMWWKGWSLSDIMFVTKQNMADAVTSVSKQLENVSEALALTKKQLTKRLKNLDWKMEEQMETSKLIANNVNEVDSNLSRIGVDVELIQQMVIGLEGKLEVLEYNQDMTNSGLWYLCQAAEGNQDRINTKPIKNMSTMMANRPALPCEAKAQGLQFIVENDQVPASAKESTIKSKVLDTDNYETKNYPAMKTRIHRSYAAVGMSLASNLY